MDKMERRISGLLLIAIFFIGCKSTEMTYTRSEDIVNVFLDERFELLSKQKSYTEYDKLLSKNFSVDLSKIADIEEEYNSTDLDIGTIPDKRFNIMGVSKSMFFLLYEKGGRIPAQVLLLGYLDKKESIFTELLVQSGDKVEELKALKMAIEKNDFVHAR